MRLRILLALLLIVGGFPPRATAQEVLATARAAAAAGRYDEALAQLQTHLAGNAADVDARLLYGLVLSWAKRYDAARTELEQVLGAAPDYLDARVALMNVEWWSGRADRARELSDQILLGEPGHPQARLVRQRLDVSNRPWTVQLTASHDRFNDDRSAWNEQSVAVGRQTAAGPLIARLSHANRFSQSDKQFELEFYPTFRSGTYALIGVGAGIDDRLYPGSRFAFDFYQYVGRGVELSAGYRRLNFAAATDIYVGTMSKYLGSWMISGKIYHVPSGDSTSYHAHLRRFFGADGSSFVGGGYSRGLSREEVRSALDLQLESDTVRAQADIALSRSVRLQFEAATSAQDRPTRPQLRQHTAQAGFAVRF